jgi:hypothetical protein
MRSIVVSSGPGAFYKIDIAKIDCAKYAGRRWLVAQFARELTRFTKETLGDL